DRRGARELRVARRRAPRRARRADRVHGAASRAADDAREAARRFRARRAESPFRASRRDPAAARDPPRARPAPEVVRCPRLSTSCGFGSGSAGSVRCRFWAARSSRASWSAFSGSSTGSRPSRPTRRSGAPSSLPAIPTGRTHSTTWPGFSQAAMARVRVPSVTCVIGEGGSGGAIAIALADRVLMQENAIYSVISPEGCAAILWRDAGEAQKAAAAFKPDAAHCLELGVIDAIVPEPSGGAQADHDEAARLLEESLRDALDELADIPGDELRRRRRAKFRSLGVFA